MTYRIALVCLGNICRSPMADVVLNARLAAAGLSDVEVTSCGTGDWHVDEPMDRRAARELSAAGYDPSTHRARHFGPDWFEHDLILVMDEQNRRDVLAQLPTDRHDRVLLFRTFDPTVPPSETVPDVPDPWYGGQDGFTDVLALVERTADALTDQLPDLRGGQKRAAGQG